MKEIKDIIHAYDAAVAAGKKSALATVVHVEGSSYRRPGARMLVRDDGLLTGAISGGCLEGDALRKALLAIRENKNKLVTYDTTDEDDAKFGVQLGCHGIVHILFEPLDERQSNNPLQLLKKVYAERRNTVLVTLFSLQKRNVQPGTVYFITNNENSQNEPAGMAEEIKLALRADIVTALINQVSVIKNYTGGREEISASIQALHPAVSLVICGAGNDAIPLAAIGRLAGWQVTIIDGRKTHANKERFAEADNICIAKPESILREVNIDERTVFVLMTHNYNYDMEALRQLLKTECRYIGLLGPKKKLDRMIDGLASTGTIITPTQLNKIYSPVGLDLGAETAEEIALSIAAEIKAVLSGNNARSLRDKEQPIHPRIEQTI